MDSCTAPAQPHRWPWMALTDVHTAGELFGSFHPSVEDGCTTCAQVRVRTDTTKQLSPTPGHSQRVHNLSCLLPTSVTSVCMGRASSVCLGLFSAHPCPPITLASTTACAITLGADAVKTSRSLYYF